MQKVFWVSRKEFLEKSNYSPNTLNMYISKGIVNVRVNRSTNEKEYRWTKDMVNTRKPRKAVQSAKPVPKPEPEEIPEEVVEEPVEVTPLPPVEPVSQKAKQLQDQFDVVADDIEKGITRLIDLREKVNIQVNHLETRYLKAPKDIRYGGTRTEEIAWLLEVAKENGISFNEAISCAIGVVKCLVGLGIFPKTSLHLRGTSSASSTQSD